MIDEATKHELLNQALKGILAGLGHGSGPTRKGQLVHLSSPIEAGDDIVTSELISAMSHTQTGSYLVIASKIVSLSQRRIVTIPKYPLPPRHSPNAMLELLQMHACPEIGPVTMHDAIGADLEQDMEDTLTFSLLPTDPNSSAADISRRIDHETGTLCDVIISDTSSGWAKGIELAGVPTLLATPIGATAGCDLYYAQRLASMAEVMRNEVELSPYMIVTPPTIRSRTRPECGKPRECGFLTFSGTEPYLHD